jgi:hypothetical protein
VESIGLRRWMMGLLVLVSIRLALVPALLIGLTAAA